MKPVTQYLTAVFELRTSRRESAALERLRRASLAMRQSLASEVAMANSPYGERRAGERKTWLGVTPLVSRAISKVENTEAA